MQLPNRKVEGHSFLAEELLIPMVNHTDGGRINMFTNHISQLLVVDEAEPPLIFTNFENEVGKYSSGFCRFDLEKDIEAQVIAKVHYNENSILFILECTNIETGELYYDLKHYRKATHLTESFGYTNKLNPNVNIGTVLPTSEKWIYKSGMLDDEMNLQYGCNLNAIYLAFEGLTYEDGIVITKEAAEKMAHHDVDVYEIIINRNDILLNMYGDENNYQVLPHINQDIKDKVLCAVRRIEKTRVIQDFKDKHLREIYHDDIIYHADGKVVDIEIFSNIDLSLEPVLNNQLNKIYLHNREAKEYFVSLVEGIRRDGYRLSDDLNYYYTKAKEYLNQDKKFHDDRNGVFDGYLLRITTAKRSPLIKGSKISNRVGGKGVISLVIDKDDPRLPKTADGRYPDIILNPMGVIGRKNITQAYEQELNAIANHIVRSSDHNPYDLIEKMMTFYEIISPKLKVHLEEFLEENEDNPDVIMEFCEEIFNQEQFPIYQPPFYDTVTPEKLELLYDIFEPPKLKFEGIQDELIMGKVYYISLKHLADGKYSVRSSEGSNLVGTPFRSNEKYKQGKALFNNNPIRMGEQELFVLSMLDDLPGVNKYIKSYSSSIVGRNYMNDVLLTTPLNKITQVMSDEINKIPSNSAQIVKAELSAMGLELVKLKEQSDGDITSQEE